MTDTERQRDHDGRELVSVIVPVLGNCPSITPTLHLIRTALHGIYDYEILVVADTTTPGPAARDTRMFALDHDARVELHEVPGQKHTAVKHGMTNARGSIVGYIDGDAGWVLDGAQDPHVGGGFQALCLPTDLGACCGWVGVRVERHRADGRACEGPPGARDGDQPGGP